MRRIRMKKPICLFALLFFTVLLSYGQHRVNDIHEYDGWYKIQFEMDSENVFHYQITQCYPNGDEYELGKNELNQLPLSVKVFCMAISEEIPIDEMTLDENGIYMRITGFSFIVDFSKIPEDKLLESLGLEIVDRYRDREW
jgi:hypothetical protein